MIPKYILVVHKSILPEMYSLKYINFWSNKSVSYVLCVSRSFEIHGNRKAY